MSQEPLVSGRRVQLCDLGQVTYPLCDSKCHVGVPIGLKVMGIPGRTVREVMIQFSVVKVSSWVCGEEITAAGEELCAWRSTDLGPLWATSAQARELAESPAWCFSALTGRGVTLGDSCVRCIFF